MSLTVPKLQLVCVLPYIGKSSVNWRTRLRRAIEKNIPFCKLNVVLDPLADLVTCLDSKIPLEKIVFRYTCSNCKVTNYEKTFR